MIAVSKNAPPAPAAITGTDMLFTPVGMIPFFSSRKETFTSFPDMTPDTGSEYPSTLSSVGM